MAATPKTGLRRRAVAGRELSEIHQSMDEAFAAGNKRQFKVFRAEADTKAAALMRQNNRFATLLEGQRSETQASGIKVGGTKQASTTASKTIRARPGTASRSASTTASKGLGRATASAKATRSATTTASRAKKSGGLKQASTTAAKAKPGRASVTTASKGKSTGASSRAKSGGATTTASRAKRQPAARSKRGGGAQPSTEASGGMTGDNFGQSSMNNGGVTDQAAQAGE